MAQLKVYSLQPFKTFDLKSDLKDWQKRHWSNEHVNFLSAYDACRIVDEQREEFIEYLQADIQHRYVDMHPHLFGNYTNEGSLYIGDLNLGEAVWKTSHDCMVKEREENPPPPNRWYFWKYFTG